MSKIKLENFAKVKFKESEIKEIILDGKRVWTSLDFLEIPEINSENIDGNKLIFNVQNKNTVELNLEIIDSYGNKWEPCTILPQSSKDIEINITNIGEVKYNFRFSNWSGSNSKENRVFISKIKCSYESDDLLGTNVKMYSDLVYTFPKDKEEFNVSADIPSGYKVGYWSLSNGLQEVSRANDQITVKTTGLEAAELVVLAGIKKIGDSCSGSLSNTCTTLAASCSSASSKSVCSTNANKALCGTLISQGASPCAVAMSAGQCSTPASRGFCSAGTSSNICGTGTSNGGICGTITSSGGGGCGAAISGTIMGGNTPIGDGDEIYELEEDEPL